MWFRNTLTGSKIVVSMCRNDPVKPLSQTNGLTQTSSFQDKWKYLLSQNESIFMRGSSWLRKVASPDEEFKIIVFSPFVLHYINEVLRLVSLWRLKYVGTAPYRTRQGGNRSTHYPGKWFVSVRVRTEDPVQPLLYLSISKPYQLSSTDPRAINSWLIARWSYQQLVDK